MVDGRDEKESSEADAVARERDGGGLTIADAYATSGRVTQREPPADQYAVKAQPNEKLQLGKLEIVGDHNNVPMRVSEEGLGLVKHYEGLRLKAYPDMREQLAIGYGHHIKKGEDFSDGITEEKADKLLRADLRWAQARVKELVEVKLTQGQYDALVSFAFNVGNTNLERSTLLKKLNAGDIEGAAKEFERWTRGGRPKKVLPGLVRRRQAEKAMFLSDGPVEA